MLMANRIVLPLRSIPAIPLISVPIISVIVVAADIMILIIWIERHPRWTLLSYFSNYYFVCRIFVIN